VQNSAVMCTRLCLIVSKITVDEMDGCTGYEICLSFLSAVFVWNLFLSDNCLASYARGATLLSVVFVRC
jgi:hypothetical protein